MVSKSEILQVLQVVGIVHSEVEDGSDQKLATFKNNFKNNPKERKNLQWDLKESNVNIGKKNEYIEMSEIYFFIIFLKNPQKPLGSSKKYNVKRCIF